MVPPAPTRFSMTTGCRRLSASFSATMRDVASMVLREAATVAIVGIAIGLLAAAALTKLLTAMLYGVSPRDPLTFGAVAIVLGAIALLAGLVPALRAARVDPLLAMTTAPPEARKVVTGMGPPGNSVTLV